MYNYCIKKSRVSIVRMLNICNRQYTVYVSYWLKSQTK